MEKDSLLYYEFKTTTQIDTIVLPDHSKVILNKHSRLTYSEQFNQKNRCVSLEGEAFFDVTKDKNNPFTIKLDDENKVTVLGTTFNVSSRRAEENLNVTLFTGSVRFENEKNKVVLSPNQELNFNRTTRNVEVVESDPGFALFWLTGVYKYQSLSMNRLVTILSKIYEIDITINNHELENVKVSGAFYNGQTIEEVLYRISRSLAIDWSIKNNKITIH
ncbi:MAG: FecR family protein [Odoribacter sp.]|nr:FecR family protein [Odoribacter sp.]